MATVNDLFSPTTAQQPEPLACEIDRSGDGQHPRATNLARERATRPDPDSRGAMVFSSILFLHTSDGKRAASAALPDFFTDLNLDQVVDNITAGKQDYDLKPFFYAPLSDTDAIQYRHDVMRDLDNPPVRAAIHSFTTGMRQMRDHWEQIKKSYYPRQKQRWFLDAVAVYCRAVDALNAALASAELRSGGFAAFRRFLDAYVSGQSYLELHRETDDLQSDLGSMHYALTIRDGSVTARKYASEIDYSADVLATFERFRQHDTEKKTEQPARFGDMDHVEAAILDNVARLYPEIFSRLAEFCAKHTDYVDETIARFDREIQFYVAYADYIAPLKELGLSFCYPEVSADSKAVASSAGFDLALATKLRREKATIVTNDLYLDGKERIFVVSGPNQGGKTTFARAFGQLHYLARLGCPVPGRKARLFLFDQLFTHFEREENIQNRRGKLQDDLVRIHSVLERATSRSLVIMNEIFTSTALTDAVFLGKKVLEKIIALDALGVCVTFMDELASMGPQTVSVVSTVVPENPAERTYRIVRHPADGLAYAMAIAEKYRLTYANLKGRLKS